MKDESAERSNQKPYKYQRTVREKIYQGRNILLQAPTGAGKTRAALEPAIIAFKNRQVDEFPQKVLYSVPMRILANGFRDQYVKRAEEKSWRSSWIPRIQTGEHSEDPLFEGQVVFATIDQVLASFLNIPYGLPTKLDNINAGAMIGSYLVFDEFHLYPRQEMMLTVLAMLTMLKDVSRFMLMSATFSPVFLKEIAKLLDAEAIYDEPGTATQDGLFSDVGSLNKSRTFAAHEGTLDAKTVINHIGQRTLVICNTVDRAQQIYRDLKPIADTRGIDCKLLHSRFYRHDRTALEDWVRTRFETPNAEYVSPRTILVATQVIEVGLDITSDVLLTECAPAASLIQRAGRCARKEGEAGKVYVFQPPDGNYAPYIDDDQEDICVKTWDALISSEFNGREMGFPEEQKLVEYAHTEADKTLLDGLALQIDQRIGQITECMRTRHSSFASTLIRKQNRVQVFIHDKPNQDEALTSTPWQYESFSLSHGALYHAYQSLVEQQIDADFYFSAGTEVPESDSESSFSRSVFKWDPIRTAGEIYKKWRFVAHPDVVSYRADIGLELVPSNERDEQKLPPKADKRPWERYAYHAERYHEHIAGLFYAYTRRHDGRQPYPYVALRDEIIYPLRQLCLKLGKDPLQAEHLLVLTLALHDVGKLNHRWQRWAHEWQQTYALDGRFGLPTIPLGDESPLAHTDYDSGNEQQRDLQRRLKVPPRGPHAVESAEACLPIFWEVSSEDEFWLAICTVAIMHHHTPSADSCNEFEPVEQASQAIVSALTICGFKDEADAWSSMVQTFSASSDASGFADSIAPHKNSYGAALMYFLFVRILRLADQRSGIYWRSYQEISNQGESL